MQANGKDKGETSLSNKLPKFIEKEIPSDEFLTCLICGKSDVLNLASHISFKHNKLKTKEYRERTGYQGPFMVPSFAKKMGQSAGKTKSPKSKLDKQKDYMSKEEFSLRSILYERSNSSCEKCGVSEESLLNANKRGLHLHHKNYDKTVPDPEDVELLCSACHGKTPHDISARYNKICKAINKLLEALEVDLMDDNFRETPRRMATYFMENFLSEFEIRCKLEEYSSSVFGNKYDGMVLLKDTPIIGMCPHHLLPVFYEVSIAYIPTKTAIGLSKLHRIAEAIARTPLMQETYTVSVTLYLQRLLGTEDVAVMVSGTHTCMTVRGVRVPDSKVMTAELRGSFMNEPSTRQEFYSLLNQ